MHDAFQLDDGALKHLQKHCPELTTINIQSCTVRHTAVGCVRGRATEGLNGRARSDSCSERVRLRGSVMSGWWWGEVCLTHTASEGRRAVVTGVL